MAHAEDFGITVRMFGPGSIEWYVWLPLMLIGLAALVCVFWPPHIRRAFKRILDLIRAR